jgi:hypothetical protein
VARFGNGAGRAILCRRWVRRFSKIPAVGESKTTNFNDARADEVIE